MMVAARYSRYRAATARFVSASVLLASLCAPLAAHSRNRTTEMMVSDIARGAGVSYETARQRSTLITEDDYQIMPGVYLSEGGVRYSYAGNNRTITGMRLYNESGATICVRANAAVVAGSLVGSRQGGSLGYNFLVEPGSSEFVIVNTATNTPGGVNSLQAVYGARIYFWLAGPASMEKRCSAIAPADLESWTQQPLPQDGAREFNFSPDLRQQLGF